MGTYKVQYKLTTSSTWLDGSTSTDNDRNTTKRATITGLTNDLTYDVRVVRTDKTPNWIVSTGQATPSGTWENTSAQVGQIEGAQTSNGTGAQIATIDDDRGVLMSLSNAALRVEAEYVWERPAPATGTQRSTFGYKRNANDAYDSAGRLAGTTGSLAAEFGSRSFFFGFEQPLPGRILQVILTVNNSNGTLNTSFTFSL